MDGFDKFVHRKEPDPFENIIVNPIESDKKGKEEGYTGLKNSTRFQVFATMVSYFKKMISPFAFKGKEGILLLNQQQAMENVIAFRKLLEVLSLDDESHNPEFMEQLTEVWHALVDDSAALSNSTIKAQAQAAVQITFFIAQVQNYPPTEEHSLGFYFTEYAGKDWIPFPFMELLQNLHEEYQLFPEKSVLGNWISLLTEILSQAGVDLDQTSF